jgi:hypothetical protein
MVPHKLRRDRVDLVTAEGGTMRTRMTGPGALRGRGELIYVGHSSRDQSRAAADAAVSQFPATLVWLSLVLLAAQPSRYPTFAPMAAQTL